MIVDPTPGPINDPTIGAGTTVGGLSAHIAGLMAGFTDDQTATHPVWPAAPLEAVLEGPEGHPGVVPEANENTEDAGFADPGDVGQLTTGLPDADDRIPTFGPINLPAKPLAG